MKRFKHVFNLDLYDLKRWEKIVLWFFPLKTYQSNDCLIWYKEVYNRLYIFAHAHINYVDYDDDTQSIPGYDKPWEN